MKTVEIKTLLHEGIENIDDKDLLLSIKDLLDEKYVPMDIKKLSPWQIQRIDNAKKQIEQGNYLTDTEADKVVDEWLKK
jgi:anti-sigma28 factor (negative regulator of flagellin synthesis)